MIALGVETTLGTDVSTGLAGGSVAGNGRKISEPTTVAAAVTGTMTTASATMMKTRKTRHALHATDRARNGMALLSMPAVGRLPASLPSDQGFPPAAASVGRSAHTWSPSTQLA